MLLCVQGFVFYLRHLSWIAESGWWCRDYNVTLLYQHIKRKVTETEGGELEGILQEFLPPAQNCEKQALQFLDRKTSDCRVWGD